MHPRTELFVNKKEECLFYDHSIGQLPYAVGAGVYQQARYWPERDKRASGRICGQRDRSVPPEGEGGCL